MDTWNTISIPSRTRLKRALQVLETLCKEEHLPIMNALEDRQRVSLAELYFETGQSPDRLERQLAALCDTGCVIHEPVSHSGYYRLNPERIRQINGVSYRINQVRQEGLEK